MDLINMPIGSEAKVSVFVKGGKIGLSSALDSAGVDASVTVSVDAEYFADELAKIIPGAIDDAVLAVIKAALKQM